MRIACQTYSWEMQLQQRPTTLWQMFDAIAAAEYTGVEFTTVTGAAWLGDPIRVKAELDARGLALAAVAVARNGFTDPMGLGEDLTLTEQVIALLKHFPGTLLQFGGAAHPDSANWQPHLDAAIRYYHEAGVLAATAGIACAVHPHSHHGSLLETREQYDYLFDKLPGTVGWCPDTGHILRGGQELLPTLDRYAGRIAYMHLKSVDDAGVWQPLGKGRVDLPALIGWLRAHGYTGWLVAEEESAGAWTDPNIAITQNAYVMKEALQ